MIKENKIPALKINIEIDKDDPNRAHIIDLLIHINILNLYANNTITEQHPDLADKISHLLDKIINR